MGKQSFHVCVLATRIQILVIIEPCAIEGLRRVTFFHAEDGEPCHDYLGYVSDFAIPTSIEIHIKHHYNA